MTQPDTSMKRDRAVCRPLGFNQAFLNHWAQGKFFVIYPDGERSMLMSRRVAKDYAKIFGGTICKFIKRVS